MTDNFDCLSTAARWDQLPQLRTPKQPVFSDQVETAVCRQRARLVEQVEVRGTPERLKLLLAPEQSGC